MTATSLSVAGRGTSRQPDYFVGASGIPRLVGLADRRVPRPVSMHSGRNMNRNSSVPVGTDHGTDPVKLNKCLYNLTVRNRGSTGARSGSKTESDIAIRNQYSNKSKSSTSGSNKNNNSISTGTALSVSSASLAPGLSNNRRNSVTSAHISSSSSASSFIPRSRNCSHNLGNCNRINSVVVHGRSHSTLLSGRQRRNVAAMGDSNRFDDDDCGNGMMRQCRFTVAVRKAPSSAADNRLNYQRKYDRTIFGYNRLEQFVLPPLQI